MSERWRPWRQLGAAHPEVDVHLVDDLPAGCDGAYFSDGQVAVILVRRTLSPIDRLAVLAHELVHHERGGSGYQADLPAGLAGLVAREEARVDRVVADRLVPRVELVATVERLAALGEPVTAEAVAAEMDCPLGPVRLALERLRAA